MPAPSFAVSVVAQAPDTTIAAARAAEAAGFDLLYTGDIQSTHREAWSTLTLMATVTSQIALGPGVTNPVTRHPAVTAGAIATLDEIADRRAFLGLGTGDSAVRNLGLPPATLARTESYCAAVRAILAEGRTVWDGVEVAGRAWPRRIPVLYSAHGPKSLRMAGRIVDGVVAGVGTTPDAVDYVREHVGAGARAAGRDPADIDIWFMTYPNLADTGGEAVAGIAAALAAGGNLLARSPASATVPDRHRAALTELAAGYTYTSHMHSTGASPNGELVTRLGLVDYLADRFALAGEPGEVRDRVRAHTDRGVDRFWTIYSRPGLDRFVEAWGREVIAT